MTIHIEIDHRMCASDKRGLANNIIFFNLSTFYNEDEKYCIEENIEKRQWQYFVVDYESFGGNCRLPPGIPRAAPDVVNEIWENNVYNMTNIAVSRNRPY